MYRGTTPTLRFALPFETSLVKTAYITFFQKDRKQFEKNLSDCVLESNQLVVTLSQEETLRFVTNVPLMIQIRTVLNDGKAKASKIMEVKVYDVLKDGVI
ncbi:hypothetical protein ACQQ4G_003131 [Listeria monocytogenes]